MIRLSLKQLLFQDGLLLAILLVDHSVYRVYSISTTKEGMSGGERTAAGRSVTLNPQRNLMSYDVSITRYLKNPFRM